MGMEFLQGDLLRIQGIKGYLGLGQVRVKDDRGNTFNAAEITFRVSDADDSRVDGYITQPPELKGQYVLFNSSRNLTKAEEEPFKEPSAEVLQKQIEDREADISFATAVMHFEEWERGIKKK